MNCPKCSTEMICPACVGKLGGHSKSERKRMASANNASKARNKRWPKPADPTITQSVDSHRDNCVQYVITGSIPESNTWIDTEEES